MKTNPLLDRWEEIRRKSGPAVLSSTGEVLRTWDQIETEAGEFERRFQNLSGNVAAPIPNHPSFFALCLAAWRAGRAVVLLDATLPEPAMRRLETDAHVALSATAHGDELVFQERDGTVPSSEICIYKITSGTTSLPKPLPFPAAELLADCEQVCETMGIRETDVNLGVVAFTHSYGFSNLVTPLLCRGTPVVICNDALPRALEAAVLRTRATVMPLVPPMFRALLTLENLPPSVRLCISAGAPLEPAVELEFWHKFRRKIHSFYGASECGGICYDASDEPTRIPGFVGTPLQGVDLALHSEDSPSVATVRSPAIPGGIFETADLLLRDGPGFRIAGRQAEFINVGGKKVAPQEIETVLLCFPGMRECAVLGCGSDSGPEKICAVIAADAPVSRPALLRHCASRLAPWQLPREIVQVDSIPRNSRGKISRRDLKALF